MSYLQQVLRLGMTFVVNFVALLLGYWITLSNPLGDDGSDQPPTPN